MQLSEMVLLDHLNLSQIKTLAAFSAQSNFVVLESALCDVA
jgi:hypothetical protein